MAPISVSNGQFLLAQIGSRSKKQKSLSMLLSASDLPGAGWTQRDEHVFRLGKLGERNPWGERAGREGNFAAARSFEQVATGSWVVSQVMPFVSADDASAAVMNFSTDKMMKNARFHGELVGEREIESPSVPKAEAVRVVVQETKISTQHGFVLYAVGSVGTTLFFVGVSQADVEVTLDYAVPFITAQAARLFPSPPAS